jgi:phage shock protein A
MPPTNGGMGVTAIMTKTDRDRISGEVDVADSKRYESASRVRQRINELETDAEILKENHPDLYEELREAVCDE